MNPRIKIARTHITAYGKRVGVTYSTGPWVEGVDPATIKVRGRNGGSLTALRHLFVIENNSDSREDYFEADSIRVLPSHPLYEQIKAVA